MIMRKMWFDGFLSQMISSTLAEICLNYVWRFSFHADGILSNKAMLLQILVAMKSMPFNSVVPTLSEYMIQRGWTRCFSSISDVGWPLYIFYLSTHLLICEFGNYWVHRKFHDIKPLYKCIHATHHMYNKQNTLSPFAGKVNNLVVLRNICLTNHFLNHDVLSKFKCVYRSKWSSLWCIFMIHLDFGHNVLQTLWGSFHSFGSCFQAALRILT